MKTERIPVIAVVGPTASGKTALAVARAKAIDAEVPSFDSMQLYRGMDIATAKPTAEEMKGIPHHMIDVVDPSETYSVARYKEDAERIVDEIRGRGKQVVLVGGTGLYLDALLKNITFLEAPGSEAVRAELQKEWDDQGASAMYEQLREIDPEYAAKIEQNNRTRVLRALEVYRLTGYTMSYQIAYSRSVPSRYEAVKIGLNTRDRKALYQRIGTRIDRMVEQGLLDEARAVTEQGSGATAAQAIGIKEMLPYLTGEASLDACIDHLKLVTRHYAKRQLTWFRRDPDTHWLYLEDYPDPEELIRAAEQVVRDSGRFGDEEGRQGSGE